MLSNILAWTSSSTSSRNTTSPVLVFIPFTRPKGTCWQLQSGTHTHTRGEKWWRETMKNDTNVWIAVLKWHHELVVDKCVNEPRPVFDDSSCLWWVELKQCDIPITAESTPQNCVFTVCCVRTDHVTPRTCRTRSAPWRRGSGTTAGNGWTDFYLSSKTNQMTKNR